MSSIKQCALFYKQNIVAERSRFSQLGFTAESESVPKIKAFALLMGNPFYIKV